jgi:hypothetical protein
MESWKTLALFSFLLRKKYTHTHYHGLRVEAVAEELDDDSSSKAT